MPDKRAPKIDASRQKAHHTIMESTFNKALLALIFAVVIWGVTPVFVRGISLALGPEMALVVRLILVALVFVVILAFTTGFHIAKQDWPKLLIVSLVGMLGYFAFSIFGFRYAPAGIGTLIFSTQPMIIAILASLIGTEKLSVTTLIGLVISFFGSALLVWGSGGGLDTKLGFETAIGCALIFLAGVTFSIFVVFSKSLIQTYGALKITGLSNAIIAVPMLPFVDRQTLTALSNLDQNAIWALVFLTTLGATASVVAWNYAAGLLRPSLLGASLYVVPIIAVIAGWAMLNEAITLNTIVAAAIILAGVGISQYKPKQRQTA
jgi:drug/metabolite transporter (DMT)-like permease